MLRSHDSYSLLYLFIASYVLSFSQIQYFRDQERKAYGNKAIRQDIAVGQDEAVVQDRSQICKVKAQCKSDYQADIGPCFKYDVLFILRYVSEQDSYYEYGDPVRKSVEIRTHYV